MVSDQDDTPEHKRPEYRHPGCNYTNADHERAARELRHLKPDLFAAAVIGFDLETDEGNQASVDHIHKVHAAVTEALPNCTQGDRTLTGHAFALLAAAHRG